LSSQLTKAMEVINAQQMLSSLVECDGSSGKKISVEEMRIALNNCMEAFELIPSNSRCARSLSLAHEVAIGSAKFKLRLLHVATLGCIPAQDFIHDTRVASS
jgi:hypothetical protein